MITIPILTDAECVAMWHIRERARRRQRQFDLHTEIEAYRHRKAYLAEGSGRLSSANVPLEPFRGKAV